MTTLASDKLVKIYRSRRVVNGVSMAVSAGEIVGLLGPNGAGKTTSFYIITGLIKPNSGRVLFDDEDITKLPMYSRARKGIGYLPQEPSIFRKLSVSDNIMAILDRKKIQAIHGSRQSGVQKILSMMRCRRGRRP